MIPYDRKCQQNKMLMNLYFVSIDNIHVDKMFLYFGLLFCAYLATTNNINDKFRLIRQYYLAQSKN